MTESAVRGRAEHWAVPDEQKEQQDDVYHRMERGEQDSSVDAEEPKSACTRSMLKYRWVDIAVLILMPLGFTLVAYYTQNHQEIPKVRVVSSTGEVTLANNTMFSYPITLRGHLCYPDVLEACALATNPPGHVCCALLKDKKAEPEMTFSTTWLIVTMAVGSLGLMLLRHYMLRKYSRLRDVGLLMVIVGFMYSVALSISTAFMFKALLGLPRPNHYALRIWNTYTAHPPRANPYDAWQSFPSGHAAFGISGFFYLSLLFLDDIRRHAKVSHRVRGVQSLLDTIALIPFLFSLWASTTVVADYWHTATDMVGGIVVGMTSALAAYVYTVSHMRSRAIKSVVGKKERAAAVQPV